MTVNKICAIIYSMDVEVDGVLVAAHELKAPLTVMRQLALSFEGAGVEDERIRREMVSVSERAMRQRRRL